MNELLTNLPHSTNWVCAYLPINSDEFDIPTLIGRGKECGTESCAEVLNGFANRGTRIIHGDDYFVVPYTDWSKLYHICRRLIHQVYYTNLYHSHSEDSLPFELFEIEMEKQATIDLWQYLSNVMHFACDNAVRIELQKTQETDVLHSLNDVCNRYRDKQRELELRRT